MSLDVQLLQLGKYRRNFRKLNDGLPRGGLAGTTVRMWDLFGKYFDEFPETPEIDSAVFTTWFEKWNSKGIGNAELPIYHSLIQQAKDDIRPELEAGMVTRLLQEQLAAEAMTLLERYANGEEIDLAASVAAATKVFEQRLNRKTKVALANRTLEELMDEEVHDHGLEWRLPELRQSMRKLRDCDFIAWAGRPDRGKTTTLCSELSYMIPQLKSRVRGRRGAWFNNEGPTHRIQRRYYQSALGISTGDMLQLSREGKLHTALIEVLGPDYLTDMQFFDAHGKTSADVERIIEDGDFGLVVFDMIDNIHFAGQMHNAGSRTDQVLEEMYKWARDLATIHEFAGIATSQLSAEAEGIPYPPMSAMKDSKTGKQGACDAIVIFGAASDLSMDHTRYLSTPKNKLMLDGQPKSLNRPVGFNAQTARMYSLAA